MNDEFILDMFKYIGTMEGVGWDSYEIHRDVDNSDFINDRLEKIGYELNKNDKFFNLTTTQKKDIFDMIVVVLKGDDYA